MAERVEVIGNMTLREYMERVVYPARRARGEPEIVDDEEEEEDEEEGNQNSPPPPPPPHRAEEATKESEEVPKEPRQQQQQQQRRREEEEQAKQQDSEAASISKLPTTTRQQQHHEPNQDHDQFFSYPSMTIRDFKLRLFLHKQSQTIEELKLENANLRNELDQLEVENEDLKFQLQINNSESFNRIHSTLSEANDCDGIESENNQRYRNNDAQTKTVILNNSFLESVTQAGTQLIVNTKAAKSMHNNDAPQRTTPFGVLRNAFSTNHMSQIGKSPGASPKTNPIPNTLQIIPSTIISEPKKKEGVNLIKNRRTLLYRVGLTIFNQNPDKGVSFLIAHNFIDDDPKGPDAKDLYLPDGFQFRPESSNLMLNFKLTIPSNKKKKKNDCPECVTENYLKRNVAIFLATRRGFSRAKIGTYFGNIDQEFNQDVLEHCLNAFDFYGIEVDIALRSFLSLFHPDGEAQKIDRLVDSFATRYVQSQICDEDELIYNTHKINLLTKSEIHCLSFAIMMLNTDLHSPKLKSSQRMTAEQFVNNIKPSLKSQPVEKEEILAIYNRIKNNQLSTSPDHVTRLMELRSRITFTNAQKKETIPNICQPHKRMICTIRGYEVYDPEKKERVGQHARQIILYNDLIVVCKIARSIKGSKEPPLIFRNSFSILNLHVDIFRSAHYLYGIRLMDINSRYTYIMFNALSSKEQTGFTNDLLDCVAECAELDQIKRRGIIDTLHDDFLAKLRQHSSKHQRELDELKPNYSQAQEANIGSSYSSSSSSTSSSTKGHLGVDIIINKTKLNPPLTSRSMTDLREDIDEGDEEERKCSANSVFSHDSGLFIRSRDISPHQSN